MDGDGTRRLLDFAYDVSAAGNLAEFRVAVTRGIRRLVEADLASYTEVHLRTGRTLAPLDPPVAGVEPITAAFGRYAHQHPLVTSPNGAAATISDFLPRRRFHRLELYDEVYRPLGAEDQIAIKLTTDTDVVIGVALNRSQASFEHRDREVLDLLRPLLVKAYGRVAERELAHGAPPSEDLTLRQREILALVAEGYGNKQIACALGLSRRTVENHLHRAYAALGVTNRTAAVAASSSRSA